MGLTITVESPAREYRADVPFRHVSTNQNTGSNVVVVASFFRITHHSWATKSSFRFAFIHRYNCSVVVPLICRSRLLLCEEYATNTYYDDNVIGCINNQMWTGRSLY